jgi:O-antigen/teichoic acid export membrane protein
LWVIGLIWVVHHHEGLRGVAVVFVGQQVVLLAFVAPTAFRYLTRKGFSLLPWREIRQLFSFSLKLQVTSFSNLVNNELNTLVIGSALSVRTVGIYNSGGNFAAQLAGVAQNVLSPATVQLGNTYGKEGAERMFQQFTRIQRIWVVAVTGWSAVGMAAGYFAVVAWLGPEFRLGGWVAVTAVAGNMFLLCAGMTSIYVTVMRQADIEMRYGLSMMVVNIVLSIPLALLGAVPVVAATGVAQLAGAVYLLRMARRRIRPDIPNFFRQVPVVRAVASGLFTFALELVLRPHLVTGPLGLLECIPPAAVGLVLFSLLVVGPRQAARSLITVVRSKQLPRLAGTAGGPTGPTDEESYRPQSPSAP